MNRNIFVYGMFLGMFLCKENCISLRKRKTIWQISWIQKSESRNISFKLYYTTTEQNDALREFFLYVVTKTCRISFLKLGISLDASYFRVKSPKQSVIGTIGGIRGDPSMFLKGAKHPLYSPIYIKSSQLDEICLKTWFSFSFSKSKFLKFSI